jgi:hypothetical protein
MKGNPLHTKNRYRSLIGGLATIAAVAIGSIVAAAPAQATVTLDVTAAPYNANTTGSSNDRSAIQQAIDDANAAGGGTVLLPGGTSGSPKVYLSGNLLLKSNVTLQIKQYATLKQSANTADYSPTPGLGHTVDNSFQWNYYMYKNQPFIYGALGATNEAVIGQDSSHLGLIEMTRGASDATTIYMFPIGIFGVAGVTVQNLHITHSSSVMLGIYQDSNALVSGMTLDTPGTPVNIGGMEIQDSQNVHVTGNTLTGLNDDGIALDSIGHPDPQCGTGYWCGGFTSEFLDTVEVDHNVVTTNCCKALAWIPWGASDSNTGISHINIHDNTFNAGVNGAAVGCWCSDPYNGSGGQSPTSHVTFANDTYVGSTSGFSQVVGTDITTDFGGGGVNFVNPGFETGSLTPWVGTGASGQYGVYGSPQGQTGTWEGYIQLYNLGSTSVSQTRVLTASTNYTFNLDTETQGIPGRMYVKNTCTSVIVASLSFSNTTWQTQTLAFATPSTACATGFALGVDNYGQTSSAGWANIDQANLTQTSSLPSNFVNPGFETGVLTPWVGSGASGKNQYGVYGVPQGQTGTWEGYIQLYNFGYTYVGQTLGLSGSTTYTFHLDTQTDGSSTRMYVQNLCTSGIIASVLFSNTTWQTKTLQFTTSSTTCSTGFSLGVDNSGNSSSTGWANIDQANLTSP